MDILPVVLEKLIKDPLVQGMIVKSVVDGLHELFKKVDASGLGVKNEKWLHPLSIVLSTLVTAINLASTGHLENVDLTALKDLVLTFLGTKAVGTEWVRNLARKVKNGK